MRIVLTGGGTGGHLYPLEPIAEAIRTLYGQEQAKLPARVDPEELQLYFVGVVDAAAKHLFSDLDIPTSHVPAAKLRRYISHLTISDFLFRLPIGLVWAVFKMWQLMPDVVVSKGGYGSIPVVLAATLYRIPVLLHESDVVPGLANRVLVRFATTLAVNFTSSIVHAQKYANKMVATGIPTRSSVRKLDRAAARKQLNIPDTESVLLILGGSQGASQLNELVLRILPSLVVDTTILHVTGSKHFEAIKKVSGEILANTARPEAYRVYPFLTNELSAAYGSADVVVARAGATVLAELAWVQRAVLLVPLAGAANDHQRQNAALFEQAGAARVLEPANLGKNLFERSVQELLKNAQLRARLEENIAQFHHPRAARDIAELTIKLACGFIPTYAKSSTDTASVS